MRAMSAIRVAYVHGIHGKPAPEVYRREWDAALRRLAYVREVESAMLYWSDIRNGVTENMVRQAHARARKLGQHRFHRLRPQTNSPLGYAVSLGLHILDPAIRRITHQLLSEVYLYFYGKHGEADIRAVILERMDDVMRKLRPQVIIGHSWGSVIAFDYLAHGRYDGDVDALISLGSPLGQAYVQEHVGSSTYPANVQHWLNVYDAMDPAAWPDRRISNDIRDEHGAHLIRDVEVPSVYDPEGHRDPHSWAGYLMTEPVQTELFRIAAADALWGSPEGGKAAHIHHVIAGG
jgi:hypothetical protein